MGAAFNEGIKYASGDVVAFIGADDIVASNYLKKNVKPFLKPNIMGVHPIWTCIKPEKLIGEALYYYRQFFIIKTKYSKYPQIWRRKIFNEITIDKTLKLEEDADFWERVKKIAGDKNWEFAYGDGVYYFADLEDTLAKNFRKSIWYGHGLVRVWSKYKYRLLEIVPIIFFSCAPLSIITYLLTQNNILFLYITLYFGSWLFVILKAASKHVLTWPVLLIPLLLTWRALGHLTGIFLSFVSQKAEKWGGGGKRI